MSMNNMTISSICSVASVSDKAGTLAVMVQEKITTAVQRWMCYPIMQMAI